MLHNKKDTENEIPKEIIRYLQGSEQLHARGKQRHHLGQQMRRFSCNVSQKKGGFPVQIGVLAQEEREKQKRQ